MIQYLKERITRVARRFDGILPSFSSDLFQNLHTENINKIVRCPLFKEIQVNKTKILNIFHKNYIRDTSDTFHLLYEIQLYTEWKDEKNDIPILSSGNTIFINTCVTSFLNQSAFSIFVRFSMVRARGALSRLLFLARAKNFKKLFIPIVNVVKWKKNTEMPSRFVDVTYRELTQILEKI